MTNNIEIRFSEEEIKMNKPIYYILNEEEQKNCGVCGYCSCSDTSQCNCLNKIKNSIYKIVNKNNIITKETQDKWI